MGDSVTHIRRGRIERDGEELFYEFFTRGQADAGGAGDDRPVVVLTHGAGGSHAVWYNQVPVLAERFRVLTWDSRGFGNSTCRSGRLSADAAVADLGAILDEVGADLLLRCEPGTGVPLPRTSRRTSTATPPREAGPEMDA